MRKLLLLIILMISFSGWSQSFSYRFNGNLEEPAQQQLLDKINSLNFFREVKMRYKADGQKGELLFTIPPKTVATEEEQPYSVLTIKRFLIEAGLSPDQFIEKPKS